MDTLFRKYLTLNRWTSCYQGNESLQVALITRCHYQNNGSSEVKFTYIEYITPFSYSHIRQVFR